MAHCALNAVLYGPRGKRWALTERGAASVQRDRDHLQIGPSMLRWSGDEFVIDIHEITVPWPSRLRGQVRLRPPLLTGHDFALDPAGKHRWRPLAPAARVEVSLQQPELRWRGGAYCDSNCGSEPLEHAFVRWDWSRASLGDGGCGVLYNIDHRAGPASALALRFSPQGEVSSLPPPPPATLPSGPLWRVPRRTRAEPHEAGVSVRRTLEDTPFYTRSLLATSFTGESVTAVHESLSLDRFSRLWVQSLLPFRMPRRR
jgi:carotenoid 1,2-hydratase